MSVPTAVVPEQEWNSKREALLVKEKELTHARDALAAERCRLPRVRVERDYRFEGPGGGVGLLGLPNLTHLNARDTTMVFASAGSQGAIRAYRKRIGWDVPWYATLDEFSADFDVPEYWDVNVFLRDGDQIYRRHDEYGPDELAGGRTSA